MACAMLLLICTANILLSMAYGKTPGQILDEKFQEIQTNLSAIATGAHFNLEDKYKQLEEDLKVFKIIHGACAPCLAKPGSDQCDCRNLEPKRDCLEFQQSGVKVNGVYKILASKFTSHYTYCDQTTQGGGWTVIQRRKDGSEDFYRNWNDYKNGFGNLEGEFWFGNENMHDLTANNPKKSSLLINLMIKGQSKPVWAKYNSFSIGDESTKYILHVSGFSGNTTDNLSQHNNMKFSTKDQDNDNHSQNCANFYKGAWWHNNCYSSHLNGLYSLANLCTSINWSGKCNVHPTFTEMKVRRNV